MPKQRYFFGTNTTAMNHYNSTVHHRRSIRLKGYDYAQEGRDFITICCQDRVCRFGHATYGEMILNEFGRMARHEWSRTPEIRPIVTLSEFVVMPNHMHGIICKNHRGELHSPRHPDALHTVRERDVYKTPLRLPSQTVGAIVRGYNTICNSELGVNNPV